MGFYTCFLSLIECCELFADVLTGELSGEIGGGWVDGGRSYCCLLIDLARGFVRCMHSVDGIMLNCISG